MAGPHPSKYLQQVRVAALKGAVAAAWRGGSACAGAAAPQGWLGTGLALQIVPTDLTQPPAQHSGALGPSFIHSTQAAAGAAQCRPSDALRHAPRLPPRHSHPKDCFFLSGSPQVEDDCKRAVFIIQASARAQLQLAGNGRGWASARYCAGQASWCVHRGLPPWVLLGTPCCCQAASKSDGEEQ